MRILTILGSSLLLTELFELALGLLTKKSWRDLAVMALANLLTNPPLVLLWQWSGKALPVLLLLEAGAVLAEGFCYRHCTDFKHPYLFSLFCNGISYFIGLLLGGT